MVDPVISHLIDELLARSKRVGRLQRIVHLWRGHLWVDAVMGLHRLLGTVM